MKALKCENVNFSHSKAGAKIFFVFFPVIISKRLGNFLPGPAPNDFMVGNATSVFIENNFHWARDL